MQVVFLAEVVPEQLQEIFQEEIQCWHQELFWDCRPALELIKKYIRLRSLSGHAVKSPSGMIAGYSYYLVDHPVGYIGNLYVKARLASAAIYEALLERTLHFT